MKKLLFIALLFIGCEKEDTLNCYECTYQINEEISVFTEGYPLELFKTEERCNYTEAEIKEFIESKTEITIIVEGGIVYKKRVSVKCERK